MAFDASQFMSPTGSEYEITNSLRMNGNADLDRTPDASNRKTYTLSAWVKRSGLTHASKQISLMDVYVDTNNFTRIVIESDDKLQILSRVSNQNTLALNTSPLLRDVSAWYHIVVAVDTTDGTANDRVKIYINGVEAPVASRTNPDQNYDGHINAAVLHDIGKSTDTSYDGYLAEYNFIDGLALAPSAFGETGDYGEWKPIKYAGAYGDEGFYLDFKSSGVGTAGSGTVGADRSGNGNHYTSSNIAVTDQMLDSPTNNFCTMNSLSPNTSGLTFSEGNLKMAGADIGFFGTMGVSSGKWYYEMHSTNAGSNSQNTSAVGIVHSDALHDTVDSSSNDGFQLFGGVNKARGYYGFVGNKLDEDSNASYGAAFVTGDVIGVALNLDDKEITFYKNNSSQGVAFTSLGSGEWFPLWQNWTGSVGVMNFGQDSSFAGVKTAQGNADGSGVGDFFYAPPSGFLALCTNNLPEPAVIPSEHFNTVLYDGTGAGQTITGVGFQPDWNWTKPRNNTGSHILTDSVRGVAKYHESNSTGVEQSGSTGITSFNSDGYVIGAGNDWSADADIFASWNWKAGNATLASNAFTQGSIASTCSRNVDAGFSIVSWTGNATAGATIGHGLSKAPEIVIIKNRDRAVDWTVFHGALAVDFHIKLHSANGAANSGTRFNSTDPSATLITLGQQDDANGVNGDEMIAYVFHPVEGYSSFNSYVGNGNADGTFVHTGFRPAWVLIKESNEGGEGWQIFDSKRDVDNVQHNRLKADSTNVEATNTGSSTENIDSLSNGFKCRGSSGGINQSGSTYLYLAFAETPFKYSNAR